MTITLPREIEELVNERVRSGMFDSPEEVIIASLRLLKAQENGVDALRREIMRGIEDIEQGRFTTYKNDAELDALSDDIIKRGREQRETLPQS